MRDASAQRLEGIPVSRGAEWVPRAYWNAPVPLPESGPLAPQADVAVYINEGRWVVECPDCHGAQLACATDRRFMCNECANVTVGGRWRRTAWPANAAEIAAVLELRPWGRTQNWTPGETVGDLATENAAHGIGV